MMYNCSLPALYITRHNMVQCCTTHSSHSRYESLVTVFLDSYTFSFIQRIAPVPVVLQLLRNKNVYGQDGTT
jgi:hypothetical protein